MHKLVSLFKNFLHQHFGITPHPNVGGRDHLHLESIYKRSLLAPDVAINVIGRLLMNDEVFTSSMITRSGERLIRASIVGNEIRANVYELERFRDGPLFQPYDPDWRRKAVMVFHVTEHDDIRSLLRLWKTDLSYNYFEPYVSYNRTLTEAEEATISRFTYSPPIKDVA